MMVCISGLKKRTGLKVVNRHGPCSPFVGKERVTHRQILRQDQIRVNSLIARVMSSTQLAQSQVDVDESQKTTLPAYLGASLSTSNYIVTVGFGTPKKDLSIAFDTGSDLTWIQCKPCSNCYPQKEPIFDPSQSTSYLNISCDSPQCNRLASATGNPSSCFGATCQYSIGYGDGSNSAGSFARETLTLSSSDVVSNFFFGCGNDNDGLFGSTAGLLGLGRDSVSVVSQTAKKFGQVFSYCLPPTSSSAGYLTFGSSGFPSGVKFTPLVTNQKAPSLYFLEMTGIKVGGQSLPIDASVFASPGTLIDSGTVITRFQPAAYSALRSAFRSAMSNYSTAPAYELFDTCYDFSGHDSVSVPTIVLQFKDGADVNVDISGIFYTVSKSQICLAFAGNQDAGSVGIFGNRQQRSYDVVYDVARQRLGFSAGGCS